jgi:nicotinamidase-related amidase
MKTYVKDRTALIVVDPLNEFLSRWGKMWPAVGASVREVHLLLNLKRILDAARTGGLEIAYAPHHRLRPGSFSDRKYLHPSQAQILSFKAFRQDGFGGQYYKGLEPRQGEIVSSEHACSSGFAGTDLHDQLQRVGISHLIIVGMITNSCIEATARSAVDLGYHVTLVTDAVAAFSPQEHAMTVTQNYPMIAHNVLNTDQLVEALKAEEVAHAS